MSVHKKLMQARILLQGSELKKSGHNKFAGYNYFELGDFIPAIQKIFDGLDLYGGVSFGKELATLTVIDTKTKEQIVFESPMSEAALKGCHAVQNLGAVQTYIRRYLWVSCMEICEHDALDSSAGTDQPAPKLSTKSVTRDVFDSLPPEEQDFLRSHADEVKKYLANDETAKAKDYLETQQFDADEKVAIWSLFDSKARSALNPKLKAA